MGVLDYKNLNRKEIDSLVHNNYHNSRVCATVVRWIFYSLFVGWLGSTYLLQAQNPSMTLSPDTIRMGAFYNGSSIQIQGAAPADSSIVIVVRGDTRDEFFNKKERVGPIWINRDKVHVASVPSLFLSFSSADINSILDRASIDQYELDNSSIASHLVCRSHCKCSSQHGSKASLATCAGSKPDAAYQNLIRSSFIALKSGEGSYQSHPNAVQIADSGNASHYDLRFDWLRNAPPGSYRVEVYACRDRAVIGRADTTLQVIEVGFPVQMAELAKVRPWTYGVLAVLAAVFAGFTIDAITSRLRSKGRIRQKPPAKVGSPKPELAPDHRPSGEEVTEEEPIHRS